MNVSDPADLGQLNLEVCTELLGRTDPEIAGLIEKVVH